MDAQYLLRSEREALNAFLDAQREGLIRKVEGVDQTRARTTPTVSNLSLLGLLKHAATWEERWFAVVIAGQPASDGWPETRPARPDADLLVDASDTVELWLGAYRDAAHRSRGIVAQRELDDACARQDIIDCNLRYVMFHMIEETARHAGHADIIRETLDGSRGF